jgi:hypothetical protein
MDTSEANSKVDVLPSVKRFKKDLGGSLQIDIKNTQQLEFNWNDPVEGLKAGSTSASQYREESKFHLRAPKKPVGNPPARETSRTVIRGSEYDLLMKTSSLNVHCQNSGEKNGECVVAAEDQLTLTQKESSEDVSATINLSNGEVVVQSKDGSVVTLSDDQIVLINKSKAMVSLQNGIITVAGPGGVSISPPVSIGSSDTGGGTDEAIKGTTFQVTYSPLLSGWNVFHAALRVYIGAIASIADPSGTATSTFTSAIETFDALITAHSSASAAWLSQQVKIV